MFLLAKLSPKDRLPVMVRQMRIFHELGPGKCHSFALQKPMAFSFSLVLSLVVPCFSKCLLSAIPYPLLTEYIGDEETRKREVASFLGQTSHETTGGWDDAPDGRFAWGYCYKAEVGAANSYCEPSEQWPCVPGKKYYGRGPIQISYNYNYGQAGEALGLDLLNDPDLVENDPTVSFKTALWFWMTAQPPKPSCHAVIIGQWQPTPADEAGGRVPGYGLLTNIINGGLECNIPSPDARVENRIGFYKRYCDIFGIDYGENLDCYNQRPFNWGSSWSIM